VSVAGKESHMIYIIAVFLGFVVCGQFFASDITGNNIVHVKNGRPPNAGLVLGEAVPIFLFVVGGTWVLDACFPEIAIWIVLVVFLLLTVFWAISFAMLSAEFRRVISNSKRHQGDL
jgi:hypothetical protein